MTRLVHGRAGLECRSASCVSNAELLTCKHSSVSRDSSTSLAAVDFAPTPQKSSQGQPFYSSFNFMFSPTQPHWTGFSSCKSCSAHSFFPSTLLIYFFILFLVLMIDHWKLEFDKNFMIILCHLKFPKLHCMKHVLCQYLMLGP